ncbi:MAG: hypothetical protein A2075_11045 [Geobacteraceae bacterium GWC2_58_44]|nr:MAG: hypothetical protein A2075_11045 [Geobacteraceae bacterium GWC2_58_44]HBG07989.1 hypothetical protein [Geobacter sp.]
MQQSPLLGLLVLITLLAGTANSEAATVASWNFDNCTAQDSSGNGINGAINGTSSCVTGIAGKALRFTGNGGYVEIPDDQRLSPLTSLTLEASIKPESFENMFAGIVFKDGNGGSGYALYLFSGIGIQFSIGFVGEAGDYSLYDSNLVPLNEWSKIKVEVDTVAGKVRIFVNGVLKSEQDCPNSPILASQGALRIGAADLSGADFGINTNFNGIVDEVKISTNNTLLTTALIGTGKGALNSIPSGVVCSSGSCTTYVATPDPITLIATPDSNSVFSGWSGACSNPTGNCTVTMNISRSVSALFSSTLPVKVLGSPDRHYEDVSKAFASLTGVSATILAKRSFLKEDTLLDRAVAVKLKGGYDDTFGAVTGNTMLTGKLLVRLGSLRVNDIVIASSSSPVVSSTPADAAIGVSAATPIEVKLVRGIDAATVNSTNVRLVGKGRFGFFTVPGRASYDAALKTVRLRTGGLPPGCGYTLTLSGLKDLSGNPLPGATVTFSTLRNELKKSVGYHGNGSVKEYSVAAFEPDGRPASLKGYPAAGPDGVWFNADDELGANESHSYDYNYSTRRYTLADTRSYFGSSTLLTKSYNFGASDVLDQESYYGRNDDGYTAFSYNSRGYLREATRYNFRYGDKRVLSYTVSVYDPQGIKVQDVSYYTSNPDGTPLANAKVVRYASYALNAEGRLGKIVTYDDDGTDGVWFTADDTVSGYWDLSYPVDGALKRAVYHGHPGGDGIWFTADDLQPTYLEYLYDAKGVRTETRRYVAPGADGVWFTADDTRAVVNTYDTTR